jgi:hypothetical protein
MPEGYVARYRTTDAAGAPALIVADQRGNAYLYAAGALQLRATGDETGARLIALLGQPERWEPLADAEPRPLETLRDHAATPGRRRPRA